MNDNDPAHIAAVRDQLIATKKRILAFDDTTFYSKLASGESLMAHAWDGWCNYGTQANADIKFMVPKEGSDLWVDTMVVLKSSQNLDAAYQFVNFMLAKENHAWVAENILYKVPNRAAMESLDKALIDRAEQEIKRQYLSRSLYGAEVVTTITPLERNRVNVAFNVVEGEPARIADIRILGSKAFSEATLRGLFDLDTGAETGAGADFWFHAITNTELYIEPQNGARLALGDGSDL